MSIIEFMHKLDFNLVTSLKSFQNIAKNKTKIVNLDTLDTLIKKNNNNLYKYIECIKQMEELYLNDQIDVDQIDVDKKNQFLFSFNIDNDLYNKNFKVKFKETIQMDIYSHKLKSKIKSKFKNSLPPGLDIPLIINPVNPDLLEYRKINILDSKDLSPNSLNLPVIKNLKNMQ